METTVKQTNPYLSGNFCPVQVETTSLDLPVEGAIPKELNGRLLRIGPNPVKEPNSKNYHWFTGNGMVHGVKLRDGKAIWYRNRFIVDKEVARVLNRAEIPGPNPRTSSIVNTNVIEVNRKTYALVEAGELPVQIDEELNSVCRSNFQNSLERGFAAHPRFDPISGSFHTIAYEATAQSIRYLVLDKLGRAETVADIPLQQSPMIHDTAITETKVILLDLPVKFKLSLAKKGIFPFGWDAEHTPRVGLLPRTGELSQLKWFEAPSCFVFHILNTFDAGENVVIDVVRHPRMFDHELRGPNEGSATLMRWTLNTISGTLSESLLDDHAIEFPRLNKNFNGKDYRFGYTCQFSEGTNFGSVFKHDVKKQTTEEYRFAGGKEASEPIFVSRENAQSEDDGWLLTYLFDPAKETSEVVILDAQDFKSAPIATIKLAVRVPHGFHGDWIAERSD